MSPHPTFVPTPTERRLAIVTADPPLAVDLEQHARVLGLRVFVAHSLSEWNLVSPPEPPDILIFDSDLLGDLPIQVLNSLTAGEDAPELILVAPSAGGQGVFDYLDYGVADVLNRPPHSAEFRLRIRRAMESHDLGMHLASLEDEITERSRRSFTDRTVVARSPAMRRLSETLERVAKMRTTVLILGETGVGKELVARSIHFRSPRLDGPFIALNCAALPPHLIESELFGHERGAFTGAVTRRAGKFELSHRGTLFLDEIGETDLPTQAKLLRVLELQEFMRVGGTRPVRVDVRLVAATNADLERLVREGAFREDLYYRLKVITLAIPPLRERQEDIPELADSFLGQICRNNNLRQRRLTASALEALVNYPWPGNVRELMNTLEAVVVATPTETLDLEHLPAPFQHGGTVPLRTRPLAGGSLQDLEAETIRSTLLSVGGSRTRAAQILGIGVRTLRRRITELGLDRQIPGRPGRPRADQRTASGKNPSKK